MFKTFDELLEEAKKIEGKVVIIAGAHTPTAIEAAVMAKKADLTDAILVGDEKIIRESISKNFPDYEDKFEIEDTGMDLTLACKKSVELVKENKGHVILKGKTDTGTLLKAVLNKENGLRTGNIMSDVLAYETPERIILMGDGGFVPLPSLNDKVSIINNCVKVAHSLNNSNPKVALLTHSEKVNPKLPSTTDAAMISKMNQRGQIKGCLVDGPLAFDNAISKKAAEIKGIKSVVAGDADILIVPNIEAGNIFGKTLNYYCGYQTAHVVMGAKAPILIASRADDSRTKMLSMALGILSTI